MQTCTFFLSPPPHSKFGGVYTGFSASRVWKGRRLTLLAEEDVPYLGTKNTNLVQTYSALDVPPPALWLVFPRNLQLQEMHHRSLEGDGMVAPVATMNFIFPRRVVIANRVLGLNILRYVSCNI